MLISVANGLNESKTRAQKALSETLCNSPCEWTAHGTTASGVGRARTGQQSEAKTQGLGDQLG